MEFSQKLQELRKQKGLTQEELASQLYVSRTAISKWESGRGYPNIDSLKAIAAFFSVTIDELLSADEAVTLAEADGKEKEKHAQDLIVGLLDLCAALFFFMPFFAKPVEGGAQATSLLALDGISPYMTVAYFVAVVALCALGVLRLAWQNVTFALWDKTKTPLSRGAGFVAAVAFALGRQPYAVTFSLILLAVKTLAVSGRS